MKTIVLSFLLIFSFAAANSQNYQIKFAGTGASTTVDSVKVENLTQCTDTTFSGNDVLFLTGTVGIIGKNKVDDNSVKIYPNPMTGNCLVDFETTVQSNATFKLYNIIGQRILTVQELLLEGHHTYQLSGIISGIYILVIESDNFSYAAKIVSIKASTGRVEIRHINTIQRTEKQSTSSHTDKMMSLKSSKLFGMPYNPGDILKLTGKSGIYRTIFMLVPYQDTTVTFNFIACKDQDGNNYSVVKIGTQTWMAECMKTTTYNDGTAIPNVTDNYAYFHLTSPAYSWYKNDSAAYKNIYGALYNWYVVGTYKVCPTGWHVPDSTEWETMFNYLGGEQVAGGKMKEACSPYWWTPNVGAANLSGFSGIPSGSRDGYTDGNFYNLGEHCYSWSSTEYDATNARFGDLTYSNQIIWMYDMTYKSHGFSIRCIKDK